MPLRKMNSKKGETSALSILHARYVAGNPEREAAIERERLNARIARLICDYREEAGLTQKQLAERIGTTQSVISRLEDADYEGHSLNMLARVATALNRKLSVGMESENSALELRHAFQKLLYLCRLRQGWSVEEAAERTGIEPCVLSQLERSQECTPSPFMLYRLSEAYGVPQERLALLAGAFKHVPDELKKEASRFVAQADSMHKITAGERRLVEGFMKLLKSKF